MLSIFVTDLLPRSKCLLISWLPHHCSQWYCHPSGEKKSVTASIFNPYICYEVMWPDAMILVFRMLSFKSAFSLSSFNRIKKLLSYSSLSPITMVLSAHQRLLIFLPTVLIPACDSSNLPFCMMYSAYILNKHGDSVQPSCTPFTILNQSVVPFLVQTVASWPTYRFLRWQIRWSGTPIFLRIFHSQRL